jgi:hypothetical protein
MQIRLYSFLLLLWSFTFSSFAYADTGAPTQLSFSIGTISTNYAEAESNLQSTDGTSTTKVEPYSGTASSMPLDVSFEYYSKLTRSYFIRAGGPIMGSTPDRYFYSGLGMNFYFSSIGSALHAKDTRVDIWLVPKFRYYAGPGVGGAYLVYNTKSETKNDILLELGGQAGAIYTLSPKWGVKAELAIARGLGAIVSATSMKILLGSTYSLNF